MNIDILKKPEYITYDEIHELLWAANEENRRNGFHLRTAELTGRELKERIGENGICFVALDNGRLVGTLSIRYVNRNSWYYKGIIPDYILAGVLPEYQGRHINTMLSQKVFNYIKEKGYSVIELDTAMNNINAIKAYKHYGFRSVDFRKKGNLDHNNVVMVKWLDHCPYPEFYRMLRFQTKKMYVKLQERNGVKK